MKNSARNKKSKRIHKSEKLRALSFPLGGIGTGHVSLCGDGGLRQWQIFNNINHNAHVPHSFFAVYAKSENMPSLSRVLQSSEGYDDEIEAAPAVSDHIVPRPSRMLLEKLPGAGAIGFTGEYPVAEISYSLPGLPVAVALRAYSPFVPLDPDDSGLPAIVFHFHAINPTRERVNTSLLVCQQNAVGWDDSAGEIEGIRHPSYGGNHNRIIRAPGLTAAELTNSGLPDDHPRWGQMLIAVFDESASAKAQWADLDRLWEDFSYDGRLEEADQSRPSPPGRTVNAALASSVTLEPGEEGKITVVLTWYFPNRYVDWIQPTFEHEENVGKSRLWLGNRYAARFSSALNVLEYLRDNLTRFDDIAKRFREAMYESSLPAPIIDAASSQISVVRSPTCFRAADGRFYGFEGCLGASTEFIGSRGGCCPLNCTHVWNYAMTVARLFPQLERSMREIEWLHQQHASGYLPHRVVVPLYIRRPWDRWIGGPPYPALDGLLGGILKSYREFRACRDRDWLPLIWDHVRLAMDHVMNGYDRGDGIIHGPQPCTYDVEIEGANGFVESLYLAALRASEEMAKVVGDAESAERYCARFRSGREAADRLLWKRDRYVHRFDPETESVQAYGSGCHSDQLLGQWWAHSLDLGYILPRKHVRAALASIVKYNWRNEMTGHVQFPRGYLRDDEAGMLNCTWPDGGRPETPLLYSDEVWTGIEYEVAGALLFEGMTDEALAVVSAVRRRQDGRLRSPWNEVECGDHYVRAMSSWMLLEAAAGYVYDASKKIIGFAPRLNPENFKCFFAAAGGWGRYAQKKGKKGMSVQISVFWGEVDLRELRLACEQAGKVSARASSKRIALFSSSKGGRLTIKFQEPLTLAKDQTLRINIGDIAK